MPLYKVGDKMSKFPFKTPYELREYFEKQSLQKLVEINRSYGPHFEQLDNDEIQTNGLIELKTMEFAKVEENIDKHRQEFKQAQEQQISYELNLSNIRDERSDIDRVMGLRALGMPPMALYDEQTSTLCYQHSQISSELERLNARIVQIKDKVSRAVYELKILNDVIEKRTQLEQTNLVASNKMSS
jgi:hypothetical protein